MTDKLLQADLEMAALRRQQFAESGYPVTNKIAPPTTVMLPMSDGCKLETIVYLPLGSAPFHTLIYRTPYMVYHQEDMATAEEYCKRGFAYVLQMCRGTGKSEGKWEPNVNEKCDGFDTQNWVAEQEWCKDIGLLGFSYMTYTCWATVSGLNPKVKTMYMTHYGTDRFASLYKSGLFRMDLMTGWAKNNAGFPISASLLDTCRFIPQIEVDEKLWGKRVDWYRDWISNTNKGDPYWHQGFWEELLQAPRSLEIPVCIGAGWFDHHLEGTVISFNELGAAARDHSHLRIGAWKHFYDTRIDGHSNELKNIDNSNAKSSLDWFTEVLVEGKTPSRKVSVYFVGADVWKEYDEYPVPSDYVQTLYFGVDRTLDDSFSDSGKISYEYDPSNPVMSHGSEIMFTTQSAVGSLLQPEPNYRPDVISFISQPLDEDMVVCGAITVHLYVSSSAEDTAFTSKVMEVLPNGNAYNIRSSIVTLGYRNGEYERVEYTPDDIVPVTLDHLDIAWKFAKGSRIRIDISSSDFPAYAAHTNYPGIWSMQSKTKVALQTILTGKDYPSSVEIPCVYL